MTLPDGLYDQLLTDALRDDVMRTTDEHAHSLQPLTAEDAPERLADALAAQLARILDDLHGDGAEKLRQQLDLVNFLLVSLKQRLGKRADDAEPLSAPPQILQAIHQRSPKPAIPETGLAFPWLFTAGKGSPSLLTELRRELAACDQVDILVSFITHSGVRKLLDILQTKPDGTQRVVLVDFPHAEMKSIGFVTRVIREQGTGRELAAVYVPTTPNPTSGYLEIVPVELVTPTDWSVDEAMRFIISGGAVSPDTIPFTPPGAKP